MTKTVKGILIAVVAFVLLAGILVGIVVGFSVIGWRRAIQAGNEEAAARAVETISVVQIQYYTEHGSFGSFDQLVEKGHLDSRFAGATPTVDGYIYVLRVTAASAGQKASFTLNADPENAKAGKRHYFIDSSSSTVHVNLDQPASAKDPPYGR